MNYGIHGNVIPHLHMHLWPRFAEDPYDIGGIPAHVASFTRTPAEIDAMREALVDYASLRGHS
jgi:diadenosine tetraphosphate (Ap4A) HIT family hydrolase